MTYENSKQRADQEREERRVAACVNAFEGIPTERIDGKDLGQILAGELRLNGAGPRADGGVGFEFSGGVCQLLAEAYTEQFRQSGAINYLELLFNHTEIGPLTITMQRVDGLTPAKKLALAESERDALQEQVQKLAAENSIQDFIISAVRDLARETDGVTGWHLNGDLATWDEVLPELSHSDTPATDAVIREIGAKAVEGFVSKLAGRLKTAGGGDGYHSNTYPECAEYIELKGGDYVEALRAGEQP